ncbi:MAG: hypothetical protein AAB353_02030 [Candidatus Hydrogenedentota bacterium]
MITINLLPFDLRPIKRTPLPYIASGLLLVLVLFLIASVFLTNANAIRKANNGLEAHNTELGALQETVKKYNQLTEQKKQLVLQVETIQEIVSDRIIWSRQLFNLGRLLTENAWYKSVTQTTKPFNETQTRLNADTKKLELINLVVQKQVLVVSGFVIAGAEGQSDTGPLVSAFADDAEFNSMFQLERPAFEDTFIEDTAVREFTLEYVINPVQAKDGK